MSQAIERCQPPWEADGLRLLEAKVQPDVLLVLFSGTPMVSAKFLATRAKGRLDHALRQMGCPVVFSRKVAVRTVGDANRQTIDSYLAAQAVRGDFVEPAFAAKLNSVALHDPKVDLSQPQELAHSRYWNSLQLVLVTESRQSLRHLEVLAQLVEFSRRVARAKGYRLSRAAPMLDHLHLTLSIPPDVSPLEAVFAYQNNLAYLLNLGRIWKETFYVGTFGEYGMGAIRTNYDR
jgi:REP element-mobilizing transposase RayT